MIQFQTNLLDINPAYNDSIIRYNSTITGMTKSEVVISGSTYTVYPFNENFSFNFKDIAKVEINQTGFKDAILPDLTLGNFIYSDSSLQTTLNGTITTIGALTSDTTSISYKFSKNVEQLPFYNQKVQLPNDIVVLLPTQNNFDYSVTYFEGYPFDFSIRGFEIGDTFYFKNSNTGIISNSYTSTTSDVKRIFLSDGANNETITDVLPLSSNVNQVELWVNGDIKANIRVKKVESKCGVYLKWFNQNGAYSYWLFDKFYKESIKVKDLADFQGKWDNLQNITSTSESLGKTAVNTLQLSTSFNTNETEYLIDLTKSPKTEMYLHQEPFFKQNAFNFIGVKVGDDNFTIDNKMSNNKLKVTIELPAINTITH